MVVGRLWSRFPTVDEHHEKASRRKIHLYPITAGPRYQLTGRVSRPRQSRGGKSAHLHLEARLVGHDLYAAHERPDELLSLLQAP